MKELEKANKLLEAYIAEVVKLAVNMVFAPKKVKKENKKAKPEAKNKLPAKKVAAIGANKLPDKKIVFKLTKKSEKVETKKPK